MTTKNTDRTLLIIGTIGLILFLLLGLQLPCPTPNQQRQLQIVTSLAAAAVGASLPGVLSMEIPIPAGGAVRAGGALGVMLLVFWFNPASWADDTNDKSFSTASCQGWTPTGLYVPRQTLPASLDPTKSGTIHPEKALGRPVKFSFTYEFGPLRGPRNWSQVRPGVWVEMYPDPSVVTVFTEIGRKKVDECIGTIVTPKKSEDFRVFIPDVGCKLMWTRFQHGNDNWAWLAEMKDVV